MPTITGQRYIFSAAADGTVSNYKFNKETHTPRSLRNNFGPTPMLHQENRRLSNKSDAENSQLDVDENLQIDTGILVSASAENPVQAFKNFPEDLKKTFLQTVKGLKHVYYQKLKAEKEQASKD